MEVKLFSSVTVSVLSDGTACLVSSQDNELEEAMDGPIFEDNSAWGTVADFPKEPGVYSMTIKYEFAQGYSEGYASDAESYWDFIPSDIKKLSLTGQD